MRTVIGLAMVVALAAMVPACGNGDPATLDRGSDETESRRRRQFIRYRQDAETSEEDVAVFWPKLQQHCRRELASVVAPTLSMCPSDPIAPLDTQYNCADAHCQFEVELCIGHLLLEVADVTSSQVAVTLISGSEIEIPPQSTATNANIRHFARKLSTDGLVWAANTIEGMRNRALGGGGVPGFPTPGVVAPSICASETLALAPFNGMTLARSIAVMYSEFAELGREAGEAEARDHVAFADSRFGGQPQLDLASAAALSGPSLSRAAAAHVLVGGDVGLAGGVQAFCTQPRLGARGRLALSVIRTSGIDPDLVADILGTSSGTLATQVFGRLALLWGRAELDSTSTNGWSQEDILDTFNLSLDDFSDARVVFQEQLSAFARDTDVKMDPVALPGGGLPPDMYAATVNEPQAPSWLYYSALARRDVSPQADSIYGGIDTSLPLGVFEGYMHLGTSTHLDFAMSQAARLVDGAGYPAAVRAELEIGLAPLLSTAFSVRPGRIEVEVASDTTYDVVVHYATDSFYGEELLVVDNTTDLSCALTGFVEGVRCSAEIAGYPEDDTSASEYAEFQEKTTIYVPNPGVEHAIYLLRLRPGGQDRRPGSYLPVASAWVRGDIEHTALTPIVPELDRAAGELLTPSADWCVQSAVSCAGFRMDERLPLEDELTDDGDAYESSWRRYLTQARNAADLADRLGEEVVRNGLEMDLRSEGALADIETACGAAVSLSGLDAELHSSCGTGGACSAGERCVGGICVLDPVAATAAGAVDDPGMRRLAECIGDGAQLDFVTAGNRSLCVWYAGTDKNTVCQGASTGMPCPFAPENENPDPSVACPNRPAGTTPQVVATHLNFFDGAAGGDPRGGGAPPCDAVRRLRANPNSAADWAQLLESRYFEPTRLAQIGRRITWEAEARDFSTLRIDGDPIGSTGSLSSGPNWGADPSASGLSWPCAPPLEAPAGCDAGEGLLCEAVGRCWTPSERAGVNDRLARAVIAARQLAGVGLSGLRLPRIPGMAYPSSGAHQTYLEQDHSVFDWEGIPIRTSNIVESYHASDADKFDYFDEPGGGDYYCSNNGTTEMWTPLGRTPYRSHCGFFSSGLSEWPFAVLDYGEYSDGGAAISSASATSWAAVYHSEHTRRPHADVDDWLHRAFRGQTMAAGGSFEFGEAGYWGEDNHIALQKDGLDCAAQLTADHTFAKACRRAYSFIPRNVSGFWRSRSGNYAYIGDAVPSAQEVLDGLELLCAVSEQSTTPYDCNLDAPPVVSSISDSRAASQYMECVANGMERDAAHRVYAQVPVRAVTTMQEHGGPGSFPALGGAYGEEVAGLRGALIELSVIPGLMATEIRGVSSVFERVRIAVARGDIHRDSVAIQFSANAANQLAQCGAAVAGSGSIGGALGGKIQQATIMCANAGAQIMFASKLRRLEEADSELAEAGLMVAMQDEFAGHVTAMQLLSARLRQAGETINGSLTRLESIRSGAERSLGRALFLDSDGAGRVFQANTVMRRRMNTSRRRYQRARDKAVQMAWLAKRAIEQRFGVRLSNMQADMSLVPAPARWESTLCTMTGVDYDRIREAGGLDGDHYADTYIGDYVTNLEQFVESYRLDFPFQGGRDVAVVSLRDDILGVRDECSVPGRNLLYQSENLTVRADSETPGWSAEGCLPDGAGAQQSRCVSAWPLRGHGDTPFVSDNPDVGSPAAYRLSFGPPPGACDESPLPAECPCDGADCGLTDATRYSQIVMLPAGRYRVSWYARWLGTPMAPWEVFSAVMQITNLVAVEAVDGSADYSVFGLETMTHLNNFRRVHYFFDIPHRQEVRIGLRDGAVEFDGVANREVDVAGLMLEDVTDSVLDGYNPSNEVPSNWVGTSDSVERLMPVCEDTDGDRFRATHWRRACLPLCNSGFGGSCADVGELDVYCYWETQFTILQSEIESGASFGGAGFARGNFNYRFDDIAINLVGAGIRDCSESETPSTCFGGGFVAYSMEHLGPYSVRNHAGETYEAPLFIGRIEHGRALSTERYLTNPLSGADRAQIQDYVHRELRGRPLDGTYVLRVWDEPGVNFDAIEDVQILLNYRYWTRND